jgi:ESCRT-I complex subunit VPS28
MSQSELVAEVYSLLYTLNAIEKAFIKGMFKSDSEKKEYCDLVNEMLLQWSTLSKSLKIENDSENDFIRTKDLLSWCDTEELNVLKFAMSRIKSGINGFDEIENLKKIKDKDENRMDHSIDNSNNNSNSNSNTDINITNKKAIAEATSAFITLMDAIKLNYDSKDTLHPLLSDVMVKSAPIFKDFPGRNVLVSWLIKLNKMDIMDTLSEADLKQLLWDVDSAYTGFFDQL